LATSIRKSEGIEFCENSCWFRMKRDLDFLVEWKWK
jgi:hypothetical protein